jgi:hypothetical protein
MDRRRDLHHLLQATFESATGLSASKGVYAQPGSDTKLSYPCILYKLTDIPTDHANNSVYKVKHSYDLTVIDRDPISPLREAIARLPLCRFSRSYDSDGLHHYVFRIYD